MLSTWLLSWRIWQQTSRSGSPTGTARQSTLDVNGSPTGAARHGQDIKSRNASSHLFSRWRRRTRLCTTHTQALLGDRFPPAKTALAIFASTQMVGVSFELRQDPEDCPQSSAPAKSTCTRGNPHTSPLVYRNIIPIVRPFPTLFRDDATSINAPAMKSLK